MKSTTALMATALLAGSFALAGCSGGTGSMTNNTTTGEHKASETATLSNSVIAEPVASIARKVRAADSASAAAALSNFMVHVNDQRQVQVYIYVSDLSPELKHTLQKHGATDILASKPLGLYQAWVSPEALAEIATLDAVTRISAPDYAMAR